MAYRKLTIRRRTKWDSRLPTLDEPLAGLLPSKTKHLRGTITQLVVHDVAIVMIVEQRVTEVLVMADIAYILDQGRTVGRQPASCATLK